MSTSTPLIASESSVTNPTPCVSSPSSVYSNSTVKATSPSKWPMSPLPLESREAMHGAKSPTKRSPASSSPSHTQLQMSEYSRTMVVQIEKLNYSRGLSSPSSNIIGSPNSPGFSSSQQSNLDSVSPFTSTFVSACTSTTTTSTPTPRQSPGAGYLKLSKPTGVGSRQTPMIATTQNLAPSASPPIVSSSDLDLGMAPAQTQVTSDLPKTDTTLDSVAQDIPTASSTNTIRASNPSPVAQTPSYPFPRMAGKEKPPSSFTLSSLSARVPTHFGRSHTVPSTKFTTEEQIIPSLPTPMASVSFGPVFASPRPDRSTLAEYPIPNLYNLSLMLTAEPGLDAWWESVVQIMVGIYKAERVTLSVPADPTDIDNVPWGQKATFSDRDRDALSMGYLGQKTCGLDPPSGSDALGSPLPKPAAEDCFNSNNNAQPPSRPSLMTRRSFASHIAESDLEDPSLSRNPSARRAAAALRRHSHYPSTDKICDSNTQGTGLKRETLEQYDVHTPISSTAHWDLPKSHSPPSKGRVLPVLQALDYEADPLIDNNGVRRVLDRGNIVALTRTYPYLKEDAKVGSPIGSKIHASVSSSAAGGPESLRRPRLNQTESTSQLSDILGGSSTRLSRSRSVREQPGNSRIVTVPEEGDDRRPPSPSFEEHEQAPSPWSQSPAPSSATDKSSTDNPFFADSLNRDSPNAENSSDVNRPTLNSSDVPLDENSWTVLHIPLSVPILHKTSGSFNLDPHFLDEKSHRRARSSTGKAPRHSRFGGSISHKTKPPPIAILSILTPVIPYPNELAESLDHLSPHLAHSFSLCRQYSMIASELAGLRSRRTGTVGFGGLGPDGRPLPPLSTTNHDGNSIFDLSHQSVAGSITSPSEWSAVSRSAAGSPIPTPSFEDVLGPKDKRPLKTSPALLGGDGYFAGASIAQTIAADMQTAVPDESSASAVPSENVVHGPGQSQGTISLVSRSSIFSEEYSASQQRRSSLSRIWPPTPEVAILAASRPQLNYNVSTRDALQPSDKNQETPLPALANKNLPTSQSTSHLSRPVLSRGDSARNVVSNSNRDRRHSLLHSYGADFATSFPTLPQAGTVNTKANPTSTPGPLSANGGTGGSVRAVHMPPPSDKLKSLILDSLPAQVFVALPLTGEILWVNSRYLSYRGLSVQDLAADPYGSIHPDDRQEYLKAWGHSLRTGDQFSRTVRIKRFDDCYRWFYARAVASRDKRGLIMQLLGSYMDIHDQHIAELKAARQEEIAASEAKHRLLANLIPQIVFTATSEEGITFANDQWLSYTDQSFEDSLGMNFLCRVHPDDLAKFHVDVNTSQPSPQPKFDLSRFEQDIYQGLEGHHGSSMPFKGRRESSTTPTQCEIAASESPRGHDSGSSYAFNDIPIADIETLIRRGIVKVTTDNTGRIAYTAEVRLRSKKDEYRWHLVRWVEIENINSVKTGVYFGSATDINDQKLLEEKLKEAMESKSRFLSNMSHEIRTPLIGISGMITFLHDTRLTEEQQDYANTIQNSANSLLLIINDILDLSKASAGMMRLSYEWFHTRSLIEDVNELVSTMAIHKGLELNYVVDETVPAWVKGDKVRIRQVLLNVIGNAIKFTTVGEVFSRCRVFVDPEAEATKGKKGVVNAKDIMLEFIVIDTGRGFSEKEAELIFKPFSQIDGSSTRQHGGSGLGLVISRQLVELHGGEMVGQAVPNKGSQFSFTARFALPSADDYPDVNSTHTASSPGPSVTPPLPIRKTTEKHDGSHHDADSLSAALKKYTVSASDSLRSDGDEINPLITVNQDLANIAQAARASGADELEENRPESPKPKKSSTPPPPIAITMPLPPPQTYSILILCPQDHSREATSQHIEMTLPKGPPHKIRALPSADAVLEMVASQNPGPFTHVVLNVGAASNVVSTMDRIDQLECISNSTILALCDTVQRQVLMRLSPQEQPRLIRTGKVNFINKPLRPSRFATIFDPDRLRDLSIDRNRSSAERHWENQRAHYTEVGKIIGNRGYRVLLVEDNPVNRKVLTKFLEKMNVEAVVAVDGQECTEKIMAQPQGYYNMVLCDLHMPRKDGYQACQDVRAWEKRTGASPMPFIALSANVMPEVQDRCSQSGFTDYITKPVDFVKLSRTMAKFF